MRIPIPITMAIIGLLVAMPSIILGQDSEDYLLDMNLEDLLKVDVTSVSRRVQPLHDAAAAIFVLTDDDIRRSGARNIPEALRLVPGIHVGRIDSHKWAVTSRGFNGRFSNKLLVLIDGRNLYSPLFSGVYWEAQSPMLEDIARIEVIRGPGSTMWGANAVNGVINIITHHSADAQGGLVVTEAGDRNNGRVSARYGTLLGPAVFSKFYGTGLVRGNLLTPDGEESRGEGGFFQGGFQVDYQNKRSEDWMLKVEGYTGGLNQDSSHAFLNPPYSREHIDDEAEISGANILGSWRRSLSPSSEVSFKVYIDRTWRKEALADVLGNQFDYDFQHQFRAGDHFFVWGLGYRHVKSDVRESLVYLDGGTRMAFNLYSAFLQDEWSLADDRLILSAGSKIEHNEFTGLEIQPGVRLMWRLREKHRIWGAVSRAVRTPSVAESGFDILAQTIPPLTDLNPSPYPIGVLLTGNDEYSSEGLLAWEAGYRFAMNSFTADVALFYNEYSNLMGTELRDIEVRLAHDPIFLAQPMAFKNLDGENRYGAELALAWQVRFWLRSDLSYSFTETDISEDQSLGTQDQTPPRHLLNLGLTASLKSDFQVGLWLRHVSECLTRGFETMDQRVVPEYSTLVVRVAWRPGDRTELAFVGQDLLQDQHLEYMAELFTPTTEVPRSFALKFTVGF